LKQQKWPDKSIEELLQHLENDYKKAALSTADSAMLKYVEKLTLHPGSITTADIEPLRKVGFDDRAIHDICVISAYFNFVNRIADGLGVELEERFKGER
jgi:uncharacterized peroxidase-related enzyme